MATHQSGHRPGGGIASRVVTERPVRTGTGSRGAHPGGVAQLGQHVGDHTTNRPGSSGYRGEPLHNNRNFNPTRYGNELATNVGKGGPGAGRTLYGQSGQQGCHGAPAQGASRPSTRGQWPD
jgi:hypothetical protein